MAPSFIHPLKKKNNNAKRHAVQYVITTKE